MKQHIKTAVGAASTVSAARKGILNLNDARKTKDKVVIANGVASLVLTITGGWLTFRDLQASLKERKAKKA